MKREIPASVEVLGERAIAEARMRLQGDSWGQALIYEIDRLTAETVRYHDAYERLTAERDRLRAALEDIADDNLDPDDHTDSAQRALGRDPVGG